MNITDFSLSAWPPRVVLDRLVAHLKGVSDLQDVPLLGSRVYNSEREDVKFGKVGEESPCAEVKLSRTGWNLTTVDAYNMATSNVAEIWLYFYQAEPEQGKEFYDAVSDFVHWISMSLYSPALDQSGSPLGFAMNTTWSKWELPQIVMDGNAQPTDREGKPYQMESGWIARCIKIGFSTMDEVRAEAGAVKA